MAKRNMSNNSGRSRTNNIICLEGNGSRPSHYGDGYRVGGVMYTLNSTEVHAVCYERSNFNNTTTFFKNSYIMSDDMSDS